ncbi:unnamed protein product [Somion occarium]|uniref:DUF6535 domain-containing protein n=1 Tax=Somion occarium TaxID=3059160 RepID=A0ABP1EAY1_9APHY
MGAHVAFVSLIYYYKRGLVCDPIVLLIESDICFRKLRPQPFASPFPLRISPLTALVPISFLSIVFAMARSRRTRRSSSAPHCLVGVSTAGDSHTTGHNSLNSVTAAHFAADHISAPTQHPQVGPPTSPTGSGPTPPIPSSNRSGSDDSDSGVVNNLLSAISAAMFQNNIDPAEADPWTKVAKILREYDEEKIKDCKEDIDTLLVFAGLFSAVMTAFVIESYKTLQQDPADAAVLLLLQISQQLRMLAVPSVSNITSVPPGPLGDFHATPSNLTIIAQPGHIYASDTSDFRGL